MADPDVIAYTDGGCRGNPGPGGWGFLLIDPRRKKALERCGGEGGTTNNRMELTAAIRALQSLRKDGMRVRLHSDSQYVIKGMREWVGGWAARGWRKADREPVANADLWQELVAAAKPYHVAWEWVRGHNGDPGNETADALTNRAMDAIQAGRDPAWDRWRTWP